MVKITKKQAEKEYRRILNRIEKKYGNNETTNIQLNKIGKRMFGNKFIGSYPSDKIPVMLPNEYAIVNLDDSSKGGSHWVGLVKSPNNKYSYIYDSFGRSTYKIIPSLVGSGRGIIKETERDAEQDLNGIVESNCGQRCLSWLNIYNKYGWVGAKHI